MPIYFDSARGRWHFDLKKVISGRRIRVSKLLPEGWSRAQAQAYDQAQSGRLYDIATGTTKRRATIDEAVALYCEYRCPNLKSGHSVIRELAHIHWVYTGRFLDELHEVARELTENAFEQTTTLSGDLVQRPLAPATIRNKLSYLRAACRYAQTHHGLGNPDLVLTLPLPRVHNERHFYATRRQMLEVARACQNRQARAIVRLGFYSGMRLGEMLSIGVTSQLDGDILMLSDSKNGSERIVPMHPRVRVLLRYFPMPYKKRWLQRLIRSAMDECGLNHLHLHDIRHSAASSLINNGVDLYTVGTVLGHKDARSTRRYSHLSARSLMSAILKIR